ncbi:MAG: hypothetical protein ACRD63_14695 [Pyrinomonadaceae bacterium]
MSRRQDRTQLRPGNFEIFLSPIFEDAYHYGVAAYSIAAIRFSSTTCRRLYEEDHSRNGENGKLDANCRTEEEGLMDHLEDERKHSQYFIKMLSYIWSRLTEEERDFCALQLPTIIQECFRLDSNILINDLTDVGARKDIAETLAVERNTEIENQKRARTGSAATLHALRKCNFFSDPRYAVEFARSGLLDQEATLFRG